MNKLTKIENSARRQFNVYGRKQESKIIDSLRQKWEDEVLKHTGPQDQAQIKMAKLDSNGNVYTYNFSDILC